jgi:hypothetical protein
MSLFQCGKCGCVENTACSAQGFIPSFMQKCFDWTGKEELLKQFTLEKKLLCCACGPTKYRDGKLTEFGTWHNEFPRTFLPMNMFYTNRVGNLAHKETHSEDFMSYDLNKEGK